MGYDLIAKKKGAWDAWVHINDWRKILEETGANYILNFGAYTINPKKYIRKLRDGYDPMMNDGYLVTPGEAKAMAKVFRGYVYVKRAIKEDWDEISPLDMSMILYRLPNAAPPDGSFIDKIEELAIFCEQSGGFRIR